MLARDEGKIQKEKIVNMRGLLKSILVIVLILSVFGLETLCAFCEEGTGLSSLGGSKTEGTISIQYTYGKKSFENLNIRLFKVASAGTDKEFILTDQFSKYKININGVKNKNAWEKVRKTVDSYIEADQLSPQWTGVTDKSGTVKFSVSGEGIYLAEAVSVKDGKYEYYFDSIIIKVPETSKSGTVKYNLSFKPKGEHRKAVEVPDKNPPVVVVKESVPYYLVKTWADEGNQDKRPTSITVDIYENGNLFKTVELNTGNNWMYKWTSDNKDSKWSVAERNVPEGYSVTISNEGEKFTIENTYNSVKTSDNTDSNKTPIKTKSVKPGKKTSSPKTGDESMPFIWICICGLAGMLLVIAGIQLKRSEKRK